MDLQKLIFSSRFFLYVLSVGLISWICYDGLELMVTWWERDEYSHGYLIPFVALYLVWQRRLELYKKASPGSLVGVLGLFLSLFVWLLGEASSIYTIIQYAFWLAISSLTIIWVGVSGARVLWAGLVYLIFMIPLPNFLYFNLSQELQLISSVLGVAVIRWFDISVFLEGNVIDLGVYQLQVVEACSGLRYLFPLMSFGFLISYIYQGPLWQRIIIFLSTIPITVLMNSFRIGVIGVTVEHFGIAAAEGVLHDFEGWIVFMACLGVLLLEIYIFYLFSKRGRSFSSLFDLDFGESKSSGNVPALNEAVTDNASSRFPVSIIVAVLALVVAVPSSQYFSDREDILPDRTSFIEYPLARGAWLGRESSLNQNELDALKLTDHFIGNYKKVGESLAVNFYTAWYEEQRKGASIHSPRSCLPGGGWVIQQHTVEPIEGIDAYGKDLNVNRVVMQMGEHQQLVYYWFQGRGRNITNEYLAKWYIFVDSLTRQRSDGALVRLVTYVPEGSDIAEADQRMKDYLEEFYPLFDQYIPD